MKKLYLFLPLIILLLALFAGIVVFQSESAADNFKKEENARLLVGNTIFNIEIADTATKRQRGLSGREILNTDSGMLFVFEKEDFHGIWMKDMKFPIDIIWLDEEFVIVDIAANISPDSFPNVFVPRAPAFYVLELNSGVSSTYDLEFGMQLVIEL